MATSVITDARAALIPLLSGGTRVCAGNPPEDYSQTRGDCNILWMIAVVIPYHAAQHAADGTNSKLAVPGGDEKYYDYQPSRYTMNERINE